MSQVYSERLFGVHGLSGSSAFTVPAGVRCVVRAIDVYSGGDISGESFTLRGASGQAFAYWRNIGDSPGTYHLDTRQVFYAGETITAITDSGMDVTVSGYLLALP